MKNEIPIYAIDFEGSKAIGIVEFGVAGILNGDIFFSETKICAPKKSIDLKTRKITGITDSLAGQNPPFEAHCEMFSSLRQNGIFAAHNFHTEDSLLRHYIPSAGRVKNFFTGKDTLSRAKFSALSRKSFRTLFRSLDCKMSLIFTLKKSAPQRAKNGTAPYTTPLQAHS